MVGNRVGASGVVGTDFARRARPDGDAMPMSRGAPATISRALEPLTTPCRRDDRTSIGLSDVTALRVCVRAEAPWRTASDRSAALRARPGQLNFASFTRSEAAPWLSVGAG